MFRFNVVSAFVQNSLEFSYTVTNTGNLVLVQHEYTGFGIDAASKSMTMDLTPESSYTITGTQQFNATGVNTATATWTATTPLLPRSSTATVTATVIISTDTDDLDGDGVPDNVEKVADENKNGIPAFLDPAEGGDGLTAGLYLPMLTK